MKRFVMMVAVLAVVAGVAFGCTKDAFLNNSVNTLMTTKDSWEGLQKTVAQAKIDGVVTDTQWKQFVSIDIKFRATQNAAVEVLKVYAQTKKANEAGTASADDVSKAMNAVTIVLNNLTSILTEGQQLFVAWSNN